MAGVDALLEEGCDFAYIHLEAPDEMGHQGSVERKVQAIEYLDERVIRPMAEAMDRSGEDYRLLVLPDHPTPIRVRTHTADSVPYLLYDSRKDLKSVKNYNEREAADGPFIEKGHEIINHLFSE